MAQFDVAVIGAGAAGLATAIFIREHDPTMSVALIDGATRPGAKILVSGGGRCNVTNRIVTERDFRGGSAAVIRRVLRALSVEDTVAFFARIGLSLHEEADGKLFPDSNRARDVLDALLAEARRVGVHFLFGHRVTAIDAAQAGFHVLTSSTTIDAARVVLATGGQSLPKTGSDGAGYRLAQGNGHSIVPPVPALVPLLLDQDDSAIYKRLSGVSHAAAIAIWIDGRIVERLNGSLLWTHFGISGPLALNASRHWTRATDEARAVRLTLNVCPASTFDTLDGRLQSLARERPRATVVTILSGLITTSLAETAVAASGIDGSIAVSHLTKENRRRLVSRLVEWPLRVTGTRGYNYAEVTAGGVTLSEIDPGTMMSRRCPNLYLVGEILDVDGRIGGFNFQWAWSSAKVAARAIVGGIRL